MCRKDNRPLNFTRRLVAVRYTRVPLVDRSGFLLNFELESVSPMLRGVPLLLFIILRLFVAQNLSRRKCAFLSGSAFVNERVGNREEIIPVGENAVCYQACWPQGVGLT